MNKTLLLLLLSAFLASGPAVHAADDQPTDSSSQTQTNPAPQKQKKHKKKKKAKKAAADAQSVEKAKENAEANPDAVPATTGPTTNAGERVQEVPPSLKAEQKAETLEEETKNARMKTEEGSKSPFSGQFNLSYAGSSLDHPFSRYAPNPGGSTVPPLVEMSGTVSARYRIDKRTTVGVGTGVNVETPFQHPDNITAANPYVDIARSFRWGKIQNRADLSVGYYTDHQNHDQIGSRLDFTLSHEVFYEFDFGLTVGLSLLVDTSTVSGADQYQTLAAKQGQATLSLATDPYFEFALSKAVSLRSVVGIAYEHQRSMAGSFDFYRPKVYQTLGVGISPSDWLFLYPYVHAIPYSGTMGIKTTTVGMSAIINLF